MKCKPDDTESALHSLTDGGVNAFSLNPAEVEQCLSRATGVEWLCIAKMGEGIVAAMAKHAVAHMSFSYSDYAKGPLWEPDEDEGFCPLHDAVREWESSLVRSYLNGPFLSSLPSWIIKRLAPIEVGDGDTSVVDNITVLNSNEERLLLEDAPYDIQAIATLESIELSLDEEELKEEDPNIYDNDEEGWLNYDCSLSRDEDPLELWEDDYRQYSKELYDEWVNDYDAAVEARNYWLWIDEGSHSDDSRHDDERRRIDRWEATIQAYYGYSWTRDGSSTGPLNDFASSHGVCPVLCFRTSAETAESGAPIHLRDAEPLYRKLDEVHLDALCEIVKGNEEAAMEILRNNQKD